MIYRLQCGLRIFFFVYTVVVFGDAPVFWVWNGAKAPFFSNVCKVIVFVCREFLSCNKKRNISFEEFLCADVFDFLVSQFWNRDGSCDGWVFAGFCHQGIVCKSGVAPIVYPVESDNADGTDIFFECFDVRMEKIPVFEQVHITKHSSMGVGRICCQTLDICWILVQKMQVTHASVYSKQVQFEGCFSKAECIIAVIVCTDEWQRVWQMGIICKFFREIQVSTLTADIGSVISVDEIEASHNVVPF